MKEHFLELKRRVMYLVIYFIAAFLLCYYFSNEIFNAFLEPLLRHGDLTPKQIIYTHLTEAFFTYLNLAATCAMIISLPFALWQFYSFLKPGMHPPERKIASLILTFFLVLSIMGTLFAYYLVIPQAWGFFLQYQEAPSTIPLVLQAKISEYILLFVHISFAFALAFQLPNILIILCLAGLLSSHDLKKKRRIAIIGNFTTAAFLTPPDIFSQIALAIPMILLYEVSIIICKKIEKRTDHA